MAWSNNESTPYYKPVAPEVAAAPKLPQGDLLGGNLLTAMTQAAIARERAQLEQEQLMQNADLAAKDLSFKHEKLAQDYELDTKKLGLEAQSYGVLNELRKSSIDLNNEKLDQMKHGALSALQATAKFARDMASIRKQGEARFRELGVDSPELQTKDPIGFADAVDALKIEWSHAPPSTKLPQRIRELETIANQQKSDIVLNGRKQRLPIRSILSGLRSDDTHDDYYNGLKEAGQITTEQQDTGKVGEFSYSHPVNSIWNKLFQKSEKKTVEKPSPFAKKLLNQVKIFDPSKSKNMVPEDTPQSAAELRADSAGSSVYDPRTTKAGRATPQAVQDAADALNNGVDLPVAEPDPTDTDRTIQQAKMAIAQGKDPGAVRQILTDKGIDPAALDEP